MFLNKKHTWSDADEFFIQSGFTKILSKLSDEPSPRFPDLFEKYMKSEWASGPAKLVATKADDNSYYATNFVQSDGEYYRVHTERPYGYYHRRTKQYSRSADPVKFDAGKSVIFPVAAEITDQLAKGPQVTLSVG